MWSCPEIVDYWKQVIGILSNMTGKQVPYTPGVCHMGLMEVEEWSECKKMMLQETIFLAHKQILLRWMQPLAPTINQWLKAVKSDNTQ